MTNNEAKQSHKAFIHAGLVAYGMGFSILSNPYTGKQNTLWRTGFRNGEFQAGGKNASQIKKSYSFPELDEVECENCQDTMLEGERCEHCFPSFKGEVRPLGAK